MQITPNSQLKSWLTLFTIRTLFITILLSSCASPANTPATEVQPTTTVPLPTIEIKVTANEGEENTAPESLKILSAEDARNFAAQFIVTNHGWDSPDTWLEQPAQPSDNAGVQNIFTAGSWVMQVEYLASAPYVAEYQVIADHMTLVARWIGTVSAKGEVIEQEYLTE